MAASIEGDTSEVRIELASIAEQRLLANLLQLYVHDLSEIFTGVQLGADGLFGYPRLASYWSEPQTHFPFLIRSFGKVAGFALAQRGSPMSDDPSVFDVAEFFVLRGERRSGVGARAAMLLWDTFPGRWIVRVAEANRAGLPFWTNVIRRYAGDAVSQSVRDGNSHRFRVFSFEARTHLF